MQDLHLVLRRLDGLASAWYHFDCHRRRLHVDTLAIFPRRESAGTHNAETSRAELFGGGKVGQVVPPRPRQFHWRAARQRLGLNSRQRLGKALLNRREPSFLRRFATRSGGPVERFERGVCMLVPIFTMLNNEIFENFLGALHVAFHHTETTTLAVLVRRLFKIKAAAARVLLRGC